jgi:hypothetical protein
MSLIWGEWLIILGMLVIPCGVVLALIGRELRVARNRGDRADQGW